MGPPRALTADLYGMYVAAGYPDELTVWTALDDWYDMVSTGVIAGTTDDVDTAAIDAAQALAEGSGSESVPLDQMFSGRRRRSWISRLLRRGA